MATAAIAIPRSQYKTAECFTKRFPLTVPTLTLAYALARNRWEPSMSRSRSMSRINSRTVNCATLFFGCVLFHILGTWTLPLIDRDEPRFAEASREMIERGNYIVPYFDNQLRLDKPPLTYWVQVASYYIFGENDFAARFPSSVAAALTALLIFAWGRRTGEEKVGWWAAIIFTLSLQTFVHAKAAVADMWLVLFVTLASWAGYELLQGRTRNQGAAVSEPSWAIWKWHFLVFFFALALGFLAN